MIYAKPATSLVVVFRAYLASDHVTPATGKTIVITISKNGGAFGNPNAGATNATEMSSGFYKVTLDTTDTGTAGPLAVRGAVATVDDVGILYYVGQVPADVTHWIGTAAATPTTAGVPEVDVTFWGGTAAASAVVKADLETIKTQTVTCAGGVTIPAATLASTTNITAGTIATVTNAVTLPTIPTNWITADGIAADAIGSSELAATAADEIADAILARNIEGGSSTGRTVKQALYVLRNKWVSSGGTLTVYGCDDSSNSWTSTLSTTAGGGNVITTSDPA